MEVTDRRVRRTRQLLSEALAALILERGYDAITVKDITDRADVAHATFYRHYRDKDDLLMQKLDAVVQEIEGFAREPALKDAEAYLIFKHAEENHALYHILLGSRGTGQVRKRLITSLAAGKLCTCAPLHLPHAIIPAPIAATHMAGSLLLLIEWWLDHLTEYSAHQMAQYYQRLIVEATLWATVGEGAQVGLKQGE
jgi:AcrR family transcriptional regulator